jgi:predicted nucleic acid-binding protein
MLRAIDANIPLYAYADFREPRKSDVAWHLMEELAISGECVVSTQILKEFANIAIKRPSIPMSQDVIEGYLRSLMTMNMVVVDERLVLLGVARHYHSKISFYDALVVEAALAGGAEILYSEDLGYGQRFDSLRVENPFLNC